MGCFLHFYDKFSILGQFFFSFYDPVWAPVTNPSVVHLNHLKAMIHYFFSQHYHIKPSLRMLQFPRLFMATCSFDFWPLTVSWLLAIFRQKKKISDYSMSEIIPEKSSHWLWPCMPDHWSAGYLSWNGQLLKFLKTSPWQFHLFFHIFQEIRFWYWIETVSTDKCCAQSICFHSEA